jgi:hypothetical protein
MLEWSNVQPVKFVNSAGVETEVRLFYEHDPALATRTVPTGGRDLDHVAYVELGDETEALNILQNNTLLIEYDFDMNRVKKLKVPA